MHHFRGREPCRRPSARRAISCLIFQAVRALRELAVRANHALITGSGRTVAAVGAARMILAHAWHRMRTGSGTKGARRYDWAMLEVTSDDTPGGHSVLLTRRHRDTGQLSYYRCWTPWPVPLSRLIAIAVSRWRI